METEYEREKREEKNQKEDLESVAYEGLRNLSEEKKTQILINALERAFSSWNLNDAVKRLLDEAMRDQIRMILKTPEMIEFMQDRALQLVKDALGTARLELPRRGY